MTENEADLDEISKKKIERYKRAREKFNEVYSQKIYEAPCIRSTLLNS